LGHRRYEPSRPCRSNTRSTSNSTGDDYASTPPETGHGSARRRASSTVDQFESSRRCESRPRCRTRWRGSFREHRHRRLGMAATGLRMVVSSGQNHVATRGVVEAADRQTLGTSIRVAMRRGDPAAAMSSFWSEDRGRPRRRARAECSGRLEARLLGVVPWALMPRPHQCRPL